MAESRYSLLNLRKKVEREEVPTYIVTRAPVESYQKDAMDVLQAWVDDFQFEVVGKDVASTGIPGLEREYPEKVKPAKQEKPLSLDFEK